MWSDSSQERRRDGNRPLSTQYRTYLPDIPALTRWEILHQSVACQERLSVEHILIRCADYIYIRNLYFNVNTVRELFDTVAPCVDNFIYT